MEDYSTYSYKNLLAFLHNDSRYDSDGVDYAEYLLTMSDATSISDMMAIYDKVFEKTAYYIFARTYPKYWFITDSWKLKQHFYYELNQCLNENILRWYKSLENPTREQCISCLINLRQSERVKKIQNEISTYDSKIKISGDYFADKRNDLASAILKVRKLIAGSEQYRIAIEEYAVQVNELLPLGYKKSIEEKKFEEIRRISIQEELGRREARRKRLEEEKTQKLKDEKEAKKTNLIIGGIILVFCLFLMYVFFMAIGGFVGFVVLIGLIGSIPKVLLKGKF